MPARRPLLPDSELETFLERMRPKLRLLLLRYRIPIEDTEDILQQALLALVHQWEKVRDPEAWLMGTLRKTCLRYWRDRQRRRYESVDAEVLEWIAEPQPPDQERGELRHDLEQLIAQLPDRCQKVLRLRYGVGLEPAELAERLGYRRSSIRKVATRCLASLARQLVASRLPRSPRAAKAKRRDTEGGPERGGG